ncbi:Metalloendoproteinase [Melia azedarach]|uniref:Metalloendoproteinase n=1 Tax=Melia azedarach TaxID=155640 RepID=A0ACC1WUP9_MELAZ|nr:Metalloendoproteinase [Melia azedarach]
MSTSKVLPLFSFISLIIVLFSLLTRYSVLAHSNSEQISHSFGFIDHLKGCHKGDKVRGIHELKKYLETFGYLNYNNYFKSQTHATNDDFDELLEFAIKTYQLNYHLKSTGVLDEKTIVMMEKPRCGVADIINGTTRMRSSQSGQQNNESSHFHTVAHYGFFKSSPKWPASKFNLTYAFLQGTRDDAKDPIARAFHTWAANTPFKFSQTQDYNAADIKIGFYSGDHGDRVPFGSLYGALAHAYPPSDGRLHFNADQAWGVGANKGLYDLETTALHEIGHLLGLGHSSVEDALMYATLPAGVTKGLHGDDIQGIKDLYDL